MADITTTVGKITAVEAAYTPAVLAGVQAAELSNAPGASKAQAVINGIIAGSQALEGTPVPSVAGIAALVNLTVSVLNALGVFRKKTTASAVPVA